MMIKHFVTLNGFLSESRLIHREGYMGQWGREARDFKLVEPGKGIGAIVTAPVNLVGKAVVGATSLIDRGIDQFTNPNAPVELRSDDFLPRAQRDLRQMYEGVFSKTALEKPVGTIVSTTMRAFNVVQSATIDAVQKVLGGRNN